MYVQYLERWMEKEKEMNEFERKMFSLQDSP